jgi:hypothetical protein
VGAAGEQLQVDGCEPELLDAEQEPAAGGDRPAGGGGEVRHLGLADPRRQGPYLRRAAARPASTGSRGRVVDGCPAVGDGRVARPPGQGELELAPVTDEPAAWAVAGQC